MMRLMTIVALVLALAAPLAAPARADDSALEGLWTGLITYFHAHREMEMWVEIGRAPEGDLAGTIDVPAMHMKFTPLENISLRDGKASMDFLKNSERLGPNARFTFSGELSEDGSEIHGEFIAGEVVKPFHLKWVGEPGTERPAEVRSEVHELAAAGDELRSAFNRDAEHVRLVILLSPT